MGRFKKVGPVGEKEKARLNSILVELGELGSDVSVSLTKVGAEVPGLAKLAKLVPILTTLAELSFVSDEDDAQANQDATKNVFSTSSLSAASSSQFRLGGSSMLGKDSLHSLVASLSSDDLCNFKKNIFTGLFCLLLPSSKPAIHRNCMYN